MTRSVPLPKITECFAPAPRFVSLNDSLITQLMLGFVTVAALSVGHIYLRFVNQDMKVQHRQLQEQYQVLRRQEVSLEQQNAALCDTGRLREFGLRDLRMVEDAAVERTVAVLPSNVANKYSAAGASDRLIASTELPGEDEAQGTVKKVLLSIVDVNKAFAATVTSGR